MGPKENAVKRVGQIFAMHTDLECGQKYHKHDTNFNLLSGKKCRKDKLTDHLNNGKSQLNQEMIPQREKKKSAFSGIFISTKKHFGFSSNSHQCQEPKYRFPLYLLASKQLELDPFPNSVKEKEVYSSH